MGDVDTLLRAAGRGNLTKVQELVESGLAPDSANEIGYTPLMSAARSYRVEVVEFLLEAGADPNAQTTDDGQGVLFSAVGETPSQPLRQARCVELLLKAGADPDLQSNRGDRALHWAAWFGCLEAARVFLAAGASLGADTSGKTPSEVARERGHSELADLLAGGD